MARLNSQDWQAKREKIITEGMNLFMQQGFNATGIKEITDACGIPKGSFFNYFSSKEKFACEVIANGSKQMTNIYDQMLQDENLNPKERIVALYRMRMEVLVHKFQYSKGCLLNGMSQEMGSQSEPIAKATSTGLESIYQQIETVIKLAQERGFINKKRNAKDLALFMENSYRGAMVVSRSIKNQEPLDVFMEFLQNDLMK